MPAFLQNRLLDPTRFCPRLSAIRILHGRLGSLAPQTLQYLDDLI
jgi:hypothetical protein